jgi:hypothetical protein
MTTIPPSPAPYTPGPWHFNKTKLATFRRILCPDGLPVADVYGSDAEALANARLIAKAPQLLASLRRLANCPDLNVEDEGLEPESVAAWNEAVVLLDDIDRAA